MNKATVLSPCFFSPASPRQAAKTYMERSFETFTDASVDELVRHALLALQATLQVWTRGLSAGDLGCHAAAG